MRGDRRRNCGLRHFILVCTGILSFAGAVFAAPVDSQFRISSDGSSVELTLLDISRRDVLDRLFSDSGIRLDWINAALAEERMSGSYNGSLSQVARRLLEKLDFVLVYDTAVGAPRITRVIVVGAAHGQPSPGLATLQLALSGAEKSRDNFGPDPTNQTTRSQAVPGAPASLPGKNRGLGFTNRDAAGSPGPVPIAMSRPQPVPIARSAPVDLVPVPILTGLPSVAPIAGAKPPLLPAPVQSSDVRK